MSVDDIGASLFVALVKWEQKVQQQDYAGTPKIQLTGQGGKLRLGGVSKDARSFHPGHRLAGSRINNIVKAKYVRNNRDATRHIIQHIDYIQKRERDKNEPERKFYSRDGMRSRDDVIDTVMRNRGDEVAMFKIILSPKQNELNHVEYTREIMKRFEEKSGIVTDWSFVEHKNTEHHHVHIIMPGRDTSGNSFRLERDHLDLLRELANEHQYELQDLVYQREMQIHREFDLTIDEANVLLLSQRDKADMQDLGAFRPDIDKHVRDELLKPTNFDAVYFAQQLEKQITPAAGKDALTNEQIGQLTRSLEDIVEKTTHDQENTREGLTADDYKTIADEVMFLFSLTAESERDENKPQTKADIDKQQFEGDASEREDDSKNDHDGSDRAENESDETLNLVDRAEQVEANMVNNLKSKHELDIAGTIDRAGFSENLNELQAEAQSLFDSQCELIQEMEHMQTELFDPAAFKIEDMSSDDKEEQGERAE